MWTHREVNVYKIKEIWDVPWLTWVKKYIENKYSDFHYDMEKTVTPVWIQFSYQSESTFPQSCDFYHTW